MIKIDIDSSSIIEVRKELKRVRDELASLPKDAENFQETATYAGQLRDKMIDINEQVQIFAAGSKFEQAGIALGQIGNNLSNLDFEGAAEKARSLTSIVKTISFSEATKGLKDLGVTFLNLGKALLTNPLFLIPAAITGILSALGLLKPIIDSIKAAFTFLSDSVSQFLDNIGIANSKLEEMAEAEKKVREEKDKTIEKVTQENVEFGVLINRLAATNQGEKTRVDLIKEINSKYGVRLQNLKDEEKFQSQLNTVKGDYIKYLIQEVTLEANRKKLIELTSEQTDAQIELNGLLEERNRREDISKRQDELIAKTQTIGLTKQEAEENRRLSEELKKLGDEKTTDILQIGILQNKLKGLEGSINTISEISNKTNESLTNMFKPKDNGSKKTVKDSVEEIAIVLADLNDEIDTKYLPELQKTLDRIFSSFDKIDIPPVTLEPEVIVDITPEDVELTKFEEYGFLIQQKWDEIKSGIKGGNKEVIDDVINTATNSLQKTSEFIGAINNVLNAGDEQRLKDLEGNEAEQEKLRKKMFDRDKKVRIVQATIDTAANVVKSVNNSGGIPFGIPAGVAAAALGALQIAAIAKAQYGGNSTTPSANVSNQGLNPNINLFGNSNNQNSVNATTNQPINLNNQMTVKAVISETEISEVISRNSRYRSSSEL